jgi:hypothetical protein
MDIAASVNANKVPETAAVEPQKATNAELEMPTVAEWCLSMLNQAMNATHRKHHRRKAHPTRRIDASHMKDLRIVSPMLYGKHFS